MENYIEFIESLPEQDKHMMWRGVFEQYKKYKTLGSVLEIGPGEAPVLIELRSMHKQYIGIEQDPNICKNLNRDTYDSQVSFQNKFATEANTNFDTLVMVTPRIDSWTLFSAGLLATYNTTKNKNIKKMIDELKEIIIRLKEDPFDRSPLQEWQEKIRSFYKYFCSEGKKFINRLIEFESQVEDMMKFMRNKMFMLCKYNGYIHIITSDGEAEVAENIISKIIAMQSPRPTCTIYINGQIKYLERPTPAPHIKSGTNVTIKQLEAQHNGKNGRVEYQMASGRYAILNSNDASGTLLIEHENLTTIPSKQSPVMPPH